MSTGIDSPVITDLSTELVPFVTVPSTGILIPGLTSNISPTSISSIATSSNTSPFFTRAVSGERFISLVIASEVFPLERFSRYLPREIRAMITPADSK